MVELYWKYQQVKHTNKHQFTINSYCISLFIVLKISYPYIGVMCHFSKQNNKKICKNLPGDVPNNFPKFHDDWTYSLHRVQTGIQIYRHTYFFNRLIFSTSKCMYIVGKVRDYKSNKFEISIYLLRQILALKNPSIYHKILISYGW